MKLKHKKLVNYAIVIGVLITLIAIFSLLKLNEDISEYFFARGLSRAYVFLFGHISDIFPFSVFGVLLIVFVAIILASIIAIAVLLHKKERTSALATLEKTLIVIFSILLVYTMTASGCYNRKPLPIPMYNGKQLSSKETANIIENYLVDFNQVTSQIEFENGKSICPYTFDELGDILIDEYKRLDDKYFSKYTPKLKKALFSKLMSFSGTTGISFQPTGESAVNFETPACYLVLTGAHELAHAKGVMRERDANLVAYYLLVSSDKPYLRYSGYMYSLSFLTSLLRILDENLYKETMAKYPQQAIVDHQKENDFWESKQSFLNDISNFFNDIYLKMSGLADGTQNYNDPSKYSEKTEIVDGNEITTIHLEYSDTAKMLLQNALTKFGK